MNKLASPIYYKKNWGHEIVWAITDKYMAKTIEIDPNKVSELVVCERKEKSIIVIAGELVLGIGKCCDEEKLDYVNFKEGWTCYIASGMLHRYGATDKPLRLIEVSSPEIDDTIVVGDLNELGL